MKIIDNETKLFFSAGLFTAFDGFVIALLVLAGNTGVFWCIFGSPTAKQAAVALLGAVLVVQLWCVVLAFRVGVMVLRARADINLMPEAAARLAAKNLTGLAQQSQAKTTINR